MSNPVLRFSIPKGDREWREMDVKLDEDVESVLLIGPRWKCPFHGLCEIFLESYSVTLHEVFSEVANDLVENIVSYVWSSCVCKEVIEALACEQLPDNLGFEM